MDNCEGGTWETKHRKIISPWKNVAEFRDVCEAIYGETSNHITWKRALGELRTWINRRRSLCPAAVYATHAMLEVKLNDECKELEDEDLRSLYAVSLVRFFNFMSSTIQSHNMRSMYTTAIELGLETFVVDIRHICAHGTELPELSILRHTVDYCLNWLQGYYWRVQSEKMLDADAKCLKKRDKLLLKSAFELRQLFDLYDLVLECHLNRCESLKEAKVKLKNRGRQLIMLKAYWNTKNLNTFFEAFDIIVMDMVKIVKSVANRKQIAIVFAREFMKMKYFFAASDTNSAGIDVADLISAVQNLFRFLAVYGIIESVLQRLFETAESVPLASMSSVESQMKAGASFWARHIVEGFEIFMRCRKMFNVSYNDEQPKSKSDSMALHFGEFSKNVRQIYIYSGVDMKRSIIFGDSFHRPWVWHFDRSYLMKRIKAVNHLTESLFPSLWSLVKPKMHEEEIASLQKLTEIFLQRNTSEHVRVNVEPLEDKVYTLNDVFSKHKAKENSAARMEHADIDSNGWTSVKYDDYDWSKCPIGHLPWH